MEDDGEGSVHYSLLGNSFYPCRELHINLSNLSFEQKSFLMKLDLSL